MNKLEFYGYHGVLPEENKLGQRFFVDLIMGIDLKEAGESDNLGKTINYADAFQLVKEIVEGTPRKLLEAVAEDIANTLLKTFYEMSICTVKIIKPNPPIAGYYESVAVEITRGRHGK